MIMKAIVLDSKGCAELYFKQGTISNILGFMDYLPQYSYTYNELIGLSLDNLEGIREAMRIEYNEVIKSKP